MSGLVQRVRANVDDRCIATRIRKQGCSVSLDGAPVSRVIVDFDKPGSPLGSSDQRCDYLFVADAADRDGWVAPLELKRGRFHAGEFVRQLQAGANAAEKLVPGSAKVRFRPIAVVGGAMTKEEWNISRQKRNAVRFRGRQELLRSLKSGQRLADELR